MLRTPSMFYRSLKELEAIVAGHQYAFAQLGVIDPQESFNYSFGQWLYEVKGVSASAGWAYAIESLMQIDASHGNEFNELVMEFVDQWN